MALTEPGGYLLAWGCGEHGQLGAGQQFDEKLPQLVHSVHDIVYASAGQRHSACVDSSGKVYTWGYNAYGELGLGDSMPRLIPTQLTAFRRSTVKEVSGETRGKRGRDGGMEGWEIVLLTGVLSLGVGLGFLPIHAYDS